MSAVDAFVLEVQECEEFVDRLLPYVEVMQDFVRELARERESTGLSVVD